MHNFVLENPTKIIFGKNTIQQVGLESKHFGSNVLLVFGMKSLKEHGLYDQIFSSLAINGLTVIEHGGVKSNPEVEHVREGIKIAKTHHIDLILAAGGGSVIDSAKAIAAGAKVEHDVWQFFRAKKSVRSALPVGCVLTLAASGSEMNGGMVLTNQELSQKVGVGTKKLCPQFSILDPTSTYSVPDMYTAYGAVDAMAHILEFYFTCEDVFAPVQDRFMEGLLINIMEQCEKALAVHDDYNARANLMWCSTMALNGWTSAGLGRVAFPMHMIEHSLSALYNVPHGAGLSVILPAWMQWQATQHPKKFSQFAKRVLGMSVTDPTTSAMDGICHLKTWFSKINAPTSLQELSIDRKDIPKIAENSLFQAKIWRLKDYNQKIIEKILHLAV